MLEPRPDVDEIHGDRNIDLHRAADRIWDAVIDTCGYRPLEAETASRLFASKGGRYLFISSISVYDVARAEDLNEDAPLQRLPPHADATRVTPETYGALKALCEAIVRSTFRHRATILRPGLVAGPYDPTDRFTYWPLRVDAGGEVLAPVAPSEPVQYIDARHLAARRRSPRARCRPRAADRLRDRSRYPRLGSMGGQTCGRARSGTSPESGTGAARPGQGDWTACVK